MKNKKAVSVKKNRHLTVASRELYNHYLDSLEPNEFALDYVKWKRVIFEILFRISQAIIRDNLVLRTNASLGAFGVEKGKGKAKRRVDFGGTKKLGRTVFHHNLHTDCFYFKIAWKKRSQNHAINKNLGVYRFTPVLDQYNRQIGRRGLAAWIQKCATDPYIKDYDAPSKI